MEQWPLRVGGVGVVQGLENELDTPQVRHPRRIQSELGRGYGCCAF